GTLMSDYPCRDRLVWAWWIGHDVGVIASLPLILQPDLALLIEDDHVQVAVFHRLPLPPAPAIEPVLVGKPGRYSRVRDRRVPEREGQVLRPRLLAPMLERVLRPCVTIGRVRLHEHRPLPRWRGV